MNKKQTLTNLSKSFTVVELHDIWCPGSDTLWEDGPLTNVNDEMFQVGHQQFLVSEIEIMKTRLTDNGEVWQIVVDSMKISQREMGHTVEPIAGLIPTHTLTIVNYNKRSEGPVATIVINDEIKLAEYTEIIKNANNTGGYQLILTDNNGKIILKRYSAKKYALNIVKS